MMHSASVLRNRLPLLRSPRRYPFRCAVVPRTRNRSAPSSGALLRTVHTGDGGAAGRFQHPQRAH